MRRSIQFMSQEEREIALSEASRMWALGETEIKIETSLGLTHRSMRTLRKNYKDLFPPRLQTGLPSELPASSDKADHREVESVGARLTGAYRPIEGFEPQPFSTSDGCSWPIDPPNTNPLKAPVFTMCCGMPKMPPDQWRSYPYCPHHYERAHRKANP